MAIGDAMIANLLEYYPAVEVQIRCCGEEHRLRWDAGRLVTLDHEDPEGERALAALAGERNACIAVLEGWERHRDDLWVLVQTSRGPNGRIAWRDLLTERPSPPLARSAAAYATATLAQVGAITPTSSSRPGRAMLRGGEHAALADVVTAHPVLGDRLVATSAATWTQRLADRAPEAIEARPALVAALYGRVLTSLRGWLGDHEIGVRGEIGGSPATLSRFGNRIDFSLSFDWVVKVWGPGTVVISDRFAVELVDAAEDRRTFLTVGRDFSDVREVTVTAS